MSSPTTILALDPATHTGWAVWRNGSVEASGVWDLSVRRDESGGMRLVRLNEKLVTLWHSYDKHWHAFSDTELLVFESARHAAPKMQGALTTQAELQGVIKLWCEEHRLNYRGYSPSEIKKHATGKGNANKLMMKRATVEKWGKVIEGEIGQSAYTIDGKEIDDNEADARWLAELAASEYAKE